MRVRCERLLIEAGERRGLERDPAPGDFRRVGDEYLVLAMAVYARPPRGILPADFLILKAPESPVWVATAMFSVSSPELPSTWIAQISAEGNIFLAPSA